jgi:FKBP-type peptidyl-prolyl cis-trans isomerase
MKHKFLAVGFLLVGAFQSCTSDDGSGGGKKVNLEDPQEKFSYAIGMDVGASMEDFSDRLDRDALIAALNDVLDGKEPRLSQQEANAVKREVFAELREKQMGEREKEGSDFREENKAKEDVVVTESGLQMQVIDEGTGPSPSASDQVKVHYRGTLIDSTEFDNSYSRGEPAVFRVDQVIPGWSEGLQKMKVGGKYRLVIPPELGYGERGFGRNIGPNETLIFEVELLDIVDGAGGQQPN